LTSISGLDTSSDVLMSAGFFNKNVKQVKKFVRAMQFAKSGRKLAVFVPTGEEEPIEYQTFWLDVNTATKKYKQLTVVVQGDPASFDTTHSNVKVLNKWGRLFTITWEPEVKVRSLIDGECSLTDDIFCYWSPIELEHVNVEALETVIQSDLGEEQNTDEYKKMENHQATLEEQVQKDLQEKLEKLIIDFIDPHCKTRQLTKDGVFEILHGMSESLRDRANKACDSASYTCPSCEWLLDWRRFYEKDDDKLLAHLEAEKRRNKLMKELMDGWKELQMTG